MDAAQTKDNVYEYDYGALRAQMGEYLAVSTDYVVIHIANVPTPSALSVPLVPQSKLVNDKRKLLEISNQVYAERSEVDEILQDNKQQTKHMKLHLVHWGVVNVDRVQYEQSTLKSIEATFDKNDTDLNGIPTVNWVADNGLNNLVPVTLVTTPNDTQCERIQCLAESAVRKLSRGDIVQFRGFGIFMLDKLYLGRHSGPAVFDAVPDFKLHATRRSNKRNILVIFGFLRENMHDAAMDIVHAVHMFYCQPFEAVWSDKYNGLGMVLVENGLKVFWQHNFYDPIAMGMLVEWTLQCYVERGIVIGVVKSKANLINDFDSCAARSLHDCYGIHSCENTYYFGDRRRHKVLHENKPAIKKYDSKQTVRVICDFRTNQALLTYYINGEICKASDQEYTFKLPRIEQDECWYMFVDLAKGGSWVKLLE